MSDDCFLAVHSARGLASPLLNIGSISPACTSLDSKLCGPLHCPASTGLANV